MKDMAYTKTKGMEGARHGAAVVRNSIFILSAKGVQVLSSFFILIAVARYLSVAEYGEYTFIAAFVASIMALSYFGIQQVLVRDIARDRENAGRYFGAAARLRTYLSVAAGVFLLASAWFMDLSAEARWAFAIAIASESFLAFSMLGRAVFQAYEKMIYEPVITLVYYIAFSASVGLAIWLRLGFLAIFAAAAFANFLQFSATSAILLKGFVRPSFDFDKGVFKRFFVDSAVVGIGVFLCQNLARINVLMLKWLGNLEAVAFFQAPHNMVLQVQLLPASLMAAMFPVLSRLQQSDPEKALMFYEKVFRFMFALNLLIAMYFSLFSLEVMRIVFGERYVASAGALSVIAWAIIPLSMDMVANAVLVVMNRQSYIIFYAGLMLGMNILSALYLVPLYGYMAATYLALASYTGIFLFSLYFVSRAGFKVGLPALVAKTACAGALAGAVMLALKGASIAVAGVAGVIVYAVVLVLARLFKREEMALFMGALSRKGSMGRLP
jgi:O-antigen/teichoic acid export membrane protein